MNLNSAIQGGLMSASTLSLIQEAIGNMDPKAPAMKLLGKPGILRKIKKRTKQGKSPDKLYIRLVNELLSGAAYYGFKALGKRKNAVLKGGLLGAGAGLTALLLNKNDNEDESIDVKK